MKKETVIVSQILVDSIISLWQDVSVSAMYTVRFILIEQTLQRLRK